MKKKRTKINCWTVTLFLPTSQLDEDFLRTMALVMPSVGVGGRMEKRIEAKIQGAFLVVLRGLVDFFFSSSKFSRRSPTFKVSWYPLNLPWWLFSLW